MVGLNSPAGKIYSIAKETGYTINYILWRVNYPMLIMMAADAPRYEYSKKEKNIEITSKEQADALFPT